MDWPEIRIVKESPKKPGKRAPKSREIAAVLLGCVEADALWSLGGSKTRRPVWMCYLATPGASAPFSANLRSGARAREARRSSAEDSFEVPRSARMKWMTQEVEAGVITTCYSPGLFHLEPALPPDDVRFIFMPPRWWVRTQAEKLRPTFGERAEDAARAALFAAYLDRRTRLPILKDVRFHTRLLEAAREERWVQAPMESRWEGGWMYEQGTVECGLDRPLACRVTHEVLEEFLARQVRRYYEEEVAVHGPARVRQGGRVLPGSDRPPEQLRLDFHLAVP